MTRDQRIRIAISHIKCPREREMMKLYVLSHPDLLRDMLRVRCNLFRRKGLIR